MAAAMRALMEQNRTLIERVERLAPLQLPLPPQDVPVNGAGNGGIVHDDGEGGVVGENDARQDPPRRSGGTPEAHSETVPRRAEDEGEKTENMEVAERIRAMQAQVDRVMAAVRNPNIIDDIVDKTETPFTLVVMECPLPPKFRMPAVDPYDGSNDPLDHLDAYNSTMHLHAVPDEIKCRAFSITLKGPARAWFNKIKPGSISDFKQLSKQFASYFIGGQRQRKPPAHLLTVRPSRDESLREYVNVSTESCWK